MSSRRSIGNTFHVTTVTDGQRGKAGRFYYFAGDWNSSTTYVMTDTQAPYVKASNGSFYMLDNAGNGGSNVNSTNQNPTNSSYGNGKPWSVMQSDHQYYIAKAYFGEYAQLGAFVINKDWMISQYGTLVDSNGTETAAEGNSLKLFGNNIHNGTITVRVRFTASGTATLTATASSESCDKGRMKTSGGTTLIEVGGKQSVTRDQPVTSGDYIDLSYSKDGSVSSNDDMITFTVEGVSYTVSLVSATSGMTWTGSSSSGNSAYTYFDPTDPMASTPPSSGYKFRPNVAIDGLTGKTYQNDAYISGTLKATKYYVSKQKVPLTMSGSTPDTKDVNPGTQLVEVTSNGTSGYSNYLRLPKASENEGMEIEIFCLSNNVWGYSNVPVELTSLGGTIKNSQDYWNVFQYKCIIQPGQKAKVYSDGTVWTVYEHNTQSLSQLYTEKAYASDSIETPSLIGGKNSGDAYDSGYSADNFPVALPSCIKTSSFTLPASPQNGMVIFCKGISAQLTVTTRGHAIMNRNGTSNWCDANSSATIADRDSVILVFSSAANKWLYFSCE